MKLLTYQAIEPHESLKTGSDKANWDPLRRSFHFFNHDPLYHSNKEMLFISEYTYAYTHTNMYANATKCHKTILILIMFSIHDYFFPFFFFNAGHGH